MHALLWLIPITALAGSWVLVMSVAPELWQRHRIQQQLGEVARRTPSMSMSNEGSDLLLKPLVGAGIWSEIFIRFFAAEKKQRLLRAAGLAWSTEHFMVLRAGFGLGGLVLAMLLFKNAAAALIGMVAGVYAPYMYARRRRNKRLAAFEDQLPGAIDLMARVMRAGHPFVHSLEVVAQDAPQPLAAEFQLTYDEHRFGMPLDEAMQRLGDRLELPDAQILITAILVQRDAGGNIAEVFGRLAALIRERSVMTRQVRIHTAEGRLSGYLLSALPIVVGLLFLVVNPAYIMILVRDPIGRVLLTIGVISETIGHFWIQKIVKVDV